jgi:hypothetical protein
MAGTLVVDAIKYLGKYMINSGKVGYSTCKRSLMVEKRVKGKAIYCRQKPITLYEGMIDAIRYNLLKGSLIDPRTKQ